MHTDALLRIRDEDLLRKLNALVIQEHVTTAELLTVMAEADARRLYVPAGYSSMFAFCVEQLHLSEDAAYKRIQAARAARRCPALLAAIADGRIHLTGAGLLAPHLTGENAGELIESATHRRKSEIEEFLATRFGRAEASTRIRVMTPIVAPQMAGAPAAAAPVATAQVPMPSALVADMPTAPTPELAPAQVRRAWSDEAASMTANAPANAPSAPKTVPSYLLQCPISKETHDLLRYAQALLSHAVPEGNVDQVLQRALKALILQLEKRKAAVLSERRAESFQPKTSKDENSRISRRQTSSHGGSPRNRHIPAHIRRAVWERDERQCTFVSASGHRCGARRFLEYDHIEPVARGGIATVSNIRLRCRAHNQLEAERILGVGFMAGKREEVRLVAPESSRATRSSGAKTTESTCAGASSG